MIKLVQKWKMVSLLGELEARKWGTEAKGIEEGGRTEQPKAVGLAWGSRVTPNVCEEQSWAVFVHDAKVNSVQRYANVFVSEHSSVQVCLNGIF